MVVLRKHERAGLYKDMSSLNPRRLVLALLTLSGLLEAVCLFGLWAFMMVVNRPCPAGREQFTTLCGGVPSWLLYGHLVLALVFLGAIIGLSWYGFRLLRKRPKVMNRGIWALVVLEVLFVVGGVFWPQLASVALPPKSPAVSVTPSPTATPQPTVAITPLRWPTADYSQSFKGTVPPVPELQSIQTSEGPFGPKGAFDRISFVFNGKQPPGFAVKYVDQVYRDGSGAPVKLTGSALLQVVFSPSAAHDEAGKSTLASSSTQPVTVGYAGLQSYAVTGDFEGHVSVGIGTGGKYGFDTWVVTQDDFWWVSIDIARP
jgi:hypothetical protein